MSCNLEWKIIWFHFWCKSMVLMLSLVQNWSDSYILQLLLIIPIVNDLVWLHKATRLALIFELIEHSVDDSKMIAFGYILLDILTNRQKFKIIVKNKFTPYIPSWVCASLEIMKWNSRTSLNLCIFLFIPQVRYQKSHLCLHETSVHGILNMKRIEEIFWLLMFVNKEKGMWSCPIYISHSKTILLIKFCFVRTYLGSEHWKWT